MDNYEKLCQLYQSGYKCIRYDDVKDGKMNIYFKNFDEEKSDSIEVTDYDEKMRIKGYIYDNSFN